jgi:predicted nuclease with TOPRIM domain
MAVCQHQQEDKRMNPKMQKLRQEHEKNEARMERLKGRNRAIEKKLQELESTEILGLVHQYDMDAEQLAAFLSRINLGEVSHEEM